MKSIFDKGTVIFILAIILQITTITIVRNQNKETAKALVYAICQQSRMTANDYGSEQTCGDVQDRLNIEYLCKKRNSLASNVCWTEAK